MMSLFAANDDIYGAKAKEIESNIVIKIYMIW